MFNHHLSRRAAATLLCLLFLVSAVATPLSPIMAQGGGQGAAANGGGYGGPGMAGATGNGSGGFTMPELPDSTGGGLGGNLPGGGSGPGAALQGALQEALGQLGQRPDAPGGNLSGSNFGAALFGEGGLLAQVNNALAAGMNWAEFGGFGTAAADFVPPTPESLAQFESIWSALEASTVEQLSADLEAAIQAQAQAISSGTFEAQQTAQALYDQYWADYYAAIEAAAALYADLTAEELAQLYDDAVAAAALASDAYEQYADWYTTYCLSYPWDCYAYAYDAASATYEYVAAVASDYPAAEVILGEVEDAVWPVVETLVASEAAYEALVVFANDQLGAALTPLYAGTLTDDVMAYLSYLPAPVSAYAALLSSVQTYWGLLNGGAAMVAVADCAAGALCTIEDMALELSDASAGVYALYVNRPMPGDAAGALDLLTTVYPALDGLSFSQVMDVDAGMAFLATAYGVGASDDGTPLTVAKLVYTGVLQVEGQTVVYALVAVGETSIAWFNGLFQ